ncbi:FAD binding domain-containing protein [Lentibacillus halophilus]|uniref:FAD binding domain-containing protein n=1 Tax=Lentibacillus halophilus TaxID=295065 RepID=A0ABN0Z5A8_9BACI
MDHSTINHQTGQTAIVVGGSLAGLMTGIALAREGLETIILEKAGKDRPSGGGLQVDGSLFDFNKTERLLKKLASGGSKRSLQLWSSIEYRLRTEAESYAGMDIRYNTRVQSADQDDASAWVITGDGETIYGDILIGADGHRSMVRGYVNPHKPHASFAGYTVWQASIKETDLPKAKRPRKSNGYTMLNSFSGFVFGSITEIEDDSSDSGNRQIGIAWYDHVRNDWLRRLGAVEGSVVHHSLKGSELPEELLHDLSKEASERWSDPWLTAALHGINTRTIVGVPIKEYVPDNLVSGRMALVGDAAHAPAPITASGFNASLQDAVELGKCAAKGIQGRAAIDALNEYESKRLDTVRQMVQSGQHMGRVFGL